MLAEAKKILMSKGPEFRRAFAKAAENDGLTEAQALARILSADQVDSDATEPQAAGVSRRSLQGLVHFVTSGASH